MSKTLEQQWAEITAMIAKAKAEKRGIRDLEKIQRNITNRILRRDNRKRKAA